jgi:hypothetical protein
VKTDRRDDEPENNNFQQPKEPDKFEVVPHPRGAEQPNHGSQHHGHRRGKPQRQQRQTFDGGESGYKPGAHCAYVLLERTFGGPIQRNMTELILLQ